ncbi:MAG: prepilin-type N-terminal cleavage/methylation domain-containing protein [Candidatus Pacebacteria bacterium]|nr:prepilin-type N-terminal cleavage/methylation domain-containing protein [Candidatus Paceibacterota bacterium]
MKDFTQHYFLMSSKRGFTQHHFLMSSKRGFTLIDVLVGCSLMLIVFLSIFGIFQLGIKAVWLSKYKIDAVSIAKGEMEKIRNFSYADIGIDGRFPAGDLQSQTDIISNQVEYTIKRNVEFVINSADGVAFPEDECPQDYKKVEVKVSWEAKSPGEVKLISDFAPKNLAQECSDIGGVLFVSVFDSLGAMIDFPFIEVKDPETDEVVKTAAPYGGQYYFSLPPSLYKIVISKDGYNNNRTYGIDEIAIPEKPHSNILEGEVAEISFSIDKLADFSIDTVSIIQGEEDPVPVPFVNFSLKGEKIIGKDEQEQPVYKYLENHISNLSGHINITDLEWDSYTFSIDPYSGLDLSDINPSPQPVDLLPETNTSVILYLSAENSFLLTMQDLETQEPIFSASARLQNSDLIYDKTQYTNENGQTFFIPLDQASYELNIEAPGYEDYSGTILVFGDTSQIISLERIE